MYELGLLKNINFTRTKLYGNLCMETRESLPARKENRIKGQEGMASICIPSSWDYPRPVERVTSRCIIVGNISGKGTAAGIGKRWRLLVFKQYRELPYCETGVTLLSPRILPERHTRGVLCPDHSACWG